MLIDVKNELNAFPHTLRDDIKKESNSERGLPGPGRSQKGLKNYLSFGNKTPVEQHPYLRHSIYVQM